MIPQVRKITSSPLTHRTETLRSIADKAHAVTARIEFLNTEGERMRQLLNNVPEDPGSRLAWLNNQLHKS